MNSSSTSSSSTSTSTSTAVTPEAQPLFSLSSPLPRQGLQSPELQAQFLQGKKKKREKKNLSDLKELQRRGLWSFTFLSEYVRVSSSSLLSHPSLSFCPQSLRTNFALPVTSMNPVVSPLQPLPLPPLLCPPLSVPPHPPPGAPHPPLPLPAMTVNKVSQRSPQIKEFKNPVLLFD